MLYKVKTFKPLLLVSKSKRKGQETMRSKKILSRKKANKLPNFFVTMQELLSISATQALIPKSWSAFIEKSISRTLEYPRMVGY